MNPIRVDVIEPAPTPQPERAHCHTSFAVKDHWLENAVRRPDKDHGSTITPRLIVIHYAVTFTSLETENTLLALPYSCHLSLDEKRICQMVPFNIRASHAGASHWRGFNACNDFAIGIEIANPGPLVSKNGKWVSVNGREWKGEIFEGKSRSAPYLKYATWAAYPPEQVEKIREIIAALKLAYPTIEDVRGHEEIAPGRKIDPGPAFPIETFR